MASEVLDVSNDELNYTEILRRRENETNIKIYTRRIRNKKTPQIPNNDDSTPAPVTEVSCTTTAAPPPENPPAPNTASAPDAVQGSPLRKEDGKEVTVLEKPVENVPRNEELPGIVAVASNGVVKPLVVSRVEDRVRFNLSKNAPKNEVKELRKTLVGELDQVRSLVKQLEGKEIQLADYNANNNNNNNNQISSNSGLVSNYVGVESVGGSIGGYGNPVPQHRSLVRVNSEIVSIGHQESRLSRVNSDMGVVRNLEPRPYSRQLSVSIMENNHMGNEYVEKEKRTPKANQYYRNSEFLLGKDRLPPESNKKLKTSNGTGSFGLGSNKSRNQAFKSCTSLLQRLMKHKFGWVFNKPVDAKALGLVDYHDVIKFPMDLGTIKNRLSQNMYKDPSEFADDVRLVFHNAMTYNPKGQDVHVMAEQLLQIFEERWPVIEMEYNPYWKNQIYHDAGLPPTPTSRKAPPPQSHFAVAPIPVYGMRAFDRSEPMATTPMAVDPKIHRPHVGRKPVPKKPKAKDPNKRDMTYEEKQKLSSLLQGMPLAKLDAIVQIIKRRNTAVSQHDDEIEVDIDSVDTETLWELDRFVTNYKKSLSKYKRKAELALQAGTAANQNVAMPNTTAAVEEVQTRTDFEKTAAPPAVEGENPGNNGNVSSSSSSSSSDSGSSSSDSDSDSSSADGSDAEHSPKA